LFHLISQHFTKDLFSVTNLINYFGRQEEVDQIQISPISIQKGTTRVALYGLGSLRDERLNRMWEKQKVEFLRPEGDADDSENHLDDDDGDDNNDSFNTKNGNEGNEFFKIFALHQNRDLGRGTKNCIQESMIPDWMDVVVWVSSFVDNLGQISV
jgi:double-strand break repair protein MRE11